MNRTIQMFLVMLGALATVAATDIFLPSLPSMAVFFNASEDATQLAIPLYLIGSLLASPLVGVLSDYYGRHSVMSLGLALFLLGTAICLYALNLNQFLVGRFIQGFGAITSPIVGWALIQDLYSRDEGARIISWMGSVISMGPFLAPVLGGYIHVTFGWEGNFVLVFLLATLTLILMIFSNPQQTTIEKTEKTSFMMTLQIYARILTDKPFLYYISLFGILTCGEWCYLTLAPFYFENILKLSPDVFGLYLSGSVAFYILGTLITPFILNRLGMTGTLKTGVNLALLGSTVLLIVSLLASKTILLIVLAVGLYFLGTAIIWGPSASRALQRFDDIRGAASAVRSMVLTGSFALGGFIGSFLDDSSIIPLSLLFVFLAIACWVALQKVLTFEA